MEVRYTTTMTPFIASLEPGYQYFLTFHILGTVFGLGGATIADILFFKFLADYEISKKEADVLGLIKNVIFYALVVIIMTGLGMYLPNMAEFNASGPFLVKAFVVGVITLNGMLLHEYVAPHLIHLNMKNHEVMTRSWHRFAFALGGVSVCSWYSVFFIAMLKRVLPQSFPLLLGGYCALLIVSICATQIVETLMTKRAKRHH